MKIPVGISARHLHLTKEDYLKIFNREELTKLKDINQPGLYAAEETVTIKGPKGSIDNVRILGPFRSYSQVEVSKTDSYALGIDPKMRKSGKLDDTAFVSVIGPTGTVEVPTIIANRHVHISKEEADSLGVKDDDILTVKIDSEKPGVILAYFKVSEEAYKELHLDLDDANAFMLKQNDIVDITFNGGK